MATHAEAGDAARVIVTTPSVRLDTSSPQLIGGSVPSFTSDGTLTILATLIAVAPALLFAHSPLVAGLVAAGLVGILLAVIAIRTSPVPMVLALVPATAVASSGLVPPATYFLPVASLGVGVILAAGARWARDGILPRLPARPIVACAIAYLLAAVVATVFSISRSTSLPYLVGIAIVLVVSLWLGPAILEARSRILWFFALLGVVGVSMTAISFLLSITGPISWFGRWLGVYLVDELTIGGRPTNLLLLRTSGPFLAPGGEALVLVPSILAMIAIRPALGRWGRVIATLALVVTVLGLLSTFARAGWIAVVIGSFILAVRDLRARRIDVAAAAVGLISAVAFGALLMNWIGADYRPDLTIARTPPALVGPANSAEGDAIVPIPEVGDAGASGGAGSGEERFQTRGGSELSGRLEIWSASLRAIADSPWVGYGPGTDALAIDPYLHGESRRFAGLTSHNTWLRTWIEFGFLGIAAFVAFVLATIAVAWRRGSRLAPPSMTWGALAIFGGLLVAQGFETFLLGGVNLPSFVWTFAAGLLVVGTERDGRAVVSS